MKKVKIILLVGVMILIGVGGCKMKEDYTKDTEIYINNTSSNKTNVINKSFFGKWYNENDDFEVTIKESDNSQKASLNFSDDNMISGENLKVNRIQDNTIDVLGTNNDTIYSFTLNDDSTLVFSESSKHSNAENIPSVSAPITLKKRL
ncbi:hypothetical protein ABID30_000492 [Enterococcus rotai]|nr:hypothetical protein [Enterococcus rotai]